MVLFEREGASTATIVVVNELDNTLSVIAVRFSADAVQMAVGDPISTLPADFDTETAPPFPFYTAPSHACAIVKDAARPLLYVTNRGHDSVATFAVSERNVSAPAPTSEPLAKKAKAGKTGAKVPQAEPAANLNEGDPSVLQSVHALHLISHVACEPGRLPWDLSLDRSGEVAAVSTQYDDQLSAEGGAVALFARHDRHGLAKLSAVSIDSHDEQPRTHLSQTSCTTPNVLLVRFLDAMI